MRYHISTRRDVSSHASSVISNQLVHSLKKIMADFFFIYHFNAMAQFTRTNEQCHLNDTALKELTYHTTTLIVNGTYIIVYIMLYFRLSTFI